MSAPSTLLTMGTALQHAWDNDLQVGVMVGGVYVIGNVVAKDGHAVVLQGRVETVAIRLDQVQAVRFNNEALLALEASQS